MNAATTNQNLEQFIMDCRKGAKFASLTLTSNVKMNKTSKAGRKFLNPLLDAGAVVTYRATYQILANVSYQNMVNNQLAREEKEDQFFSQPLWGGKGEYYHRSPAGCLARHTEKGSKYFVYSPINKTDFVYFVNGRPATETEVRIIKAYLPAKKEAKSQGTDKQILWRLVSLEKIDRLALDGKVFHK